MNKTVEDFYIKASGEVLTEYLPNHWRALTDKRLDNWMTSHAWHPYEYWDAEQLWVRITSIAYTLHEVYEEAIKESNDE